MNATLRVPLDLRDEATGYSVAEMCYSNLSDFWYWYWPIATGGDIFVSGWHYEYTAQRVQLALDRGWGTIGIAWPFGTGKSTALGRLTHPWEWLHRPNMRWFGVGASKSVYDDARKSRDLILSPEYQALCAMAGVRIDLSKDQNEKKDYTNTEDGQRHSYRTGDAVIGVNADRLLVDDAINPKKVDRGSPILVGKWLEDAREKWKKDWIDRLRRRGDPDMTRAFGVRFLINQRTARGDLFDMLIEQQKEGRDDIELIVVPEEFDPDVPGGVCPADPRTEPGQLLNPNFRSAEQIAIYRAESGDRFVSARLNQRPSAVEGGSIKRSFFTRYAESPMVKFTSIKRLVITLDCAAAKGAHNDQSVAQLWGAIGSYRVLGWEWAARLDITEQPDWMREIARTVREDWGLDSVPWLVENASNGIELLKRKVVPRMLKFNPTPPKGTPKGKAKEVRAHSFAMSAAAGDIQLPLTLYAPWVEDTLDEWHAFGAGGIHDDRVDAAAMACIHFENNAAKSRFRNKLRR